MNLFTYEKVYRAYLRCKRKKSNTLVHAKFVVQLERNLYQLLQDLKSREYKVGRFRCFIVTQPVMREVFAGNFRDRIVHHLLINEIEPLIDPLFIDDSLACRKGKGNLTGIRRLRSGIQSYRDQHGEYPTYLQMDISSFFMSIQQEKLFQLVETTLKKIYLKKFKSENDKTVNRLWFEEVLFLCRTIIFNDPTEHYIRKGDPTLAMKLRPGKSLFHVPQGQGLPIGNLSSQFFANVYLNELDQFIKRELKQKRYYRYVDDFVILGKKEELILAKGKIVDFLRIELGLSINDKKTKMASAKTGIDFVGYVVRDKYLLPRRRCVQKFRSRLKNLELKKIEEIISFNCSYRSHCGYLRLGKHFKLLEDIHTDMIDYHT